MNRNFFITGGTGFIGRALLRHLLALVDALHIDSITLLTRNPERFTRLAPDIAGHGAVRLLHGDVNHFVLPTGRYTDIIHGASDTNDLLVQDRTTYFWDIVSGTKRMLDFARHCGCSRFLYLSSGAVYGPGDYPESGIPETWPIAPALEDGQSTYGQAKRASEHLCTLLSHSSAAIVHITRIFAVIGEEMPFNGQYALGNFVKDALSEDVDTIMIKGDGTPIRSFLHVDDIAHWLLKIHDSDASHTVFNVGSEQPFSIRELAEFVSHISPKPKPIAITQTESDYRARSMYLPDCSRARIHLGLIQTIDLQTAIERLFAKRQSA